MTQRTFGFTQQRLSSLPLPISKRACYYDDKMSGLGLMVYPSGKKTFFLYIRVKGRPDKIKLGIFPEIGIDDARSRATTLKADIRLGLNPRQNASKSHDDGTFEAIFRRYIEEYAKVHKKTWQQDLWEKEKYLSHLNRTQLSEITIDEVLKLHNQLAQNAGKRTANKVIGLLGAIFNRAMRWGVYQGINPVKNVTLYHLRSRERLWATPCLVLAFMMVTC